MIRRPPRSTRTDTLFPYTTLFRSLGRGDFNFPNTPPTINGNGTGGTATLTVSNGGNVTPAALLSLDARGIGGIGLTQSGNVTGGRSDERRLGKVCFSTCKTGWSPYLYKKED